MGRFTSFAAAAVLVALPLALAPVALADPAAVKVSGAESLRGASRLAIAAFNVGFIFQSVDQTKASGGLAGAFGGATRIDSKLVGVTPTMMQAVADAAYADFVKQVSNAGYKLVAPQEVFAAPQLANPHGQAAPVEVGILLEKNSKGKVTYYKPSALPSAILLPGDFQSSGLSSIGINMAAGQASMALGNYAKANAVTTVGVTYLIDFSQQKRPGAFSMGGLHVNANLSVVPSYSRMSVFGASGRGGSVTIGQPISVDGDFITTHDATSGAHKATEGAMNVAGGVAAAFGFGGMRFGKSKTVEFIAKPGNYEAGAIQAMSLASQKVVGQAAALR